ncbi:radical SAM protein [uncultured Veillonella sp.]|uniref:radical SAM protein n=1 Tax=uncultured Veillonella sp. TaxID=159268 RepID=UPI0025E4B580|nr:radical SAM protein [uncultured Veillonella sp.]
MKEIQGQSFLQNHPCYNKAASANWGRLHLPVAPNCNIQCNYCNRKYDCANENRPGVTQHVYTPQEAAAFVHKVFEARQDISVVGIAGPGDPMCDADKTLETFRLVKNDFPHVMLCLSSNGLAVPDYVDEIADLGITHVTITANAIDPEIAKHVYSMVRYEGNIYKGIDGARILLERQAESIRKLKEKNIIVKINTVVVPDVNMDHVPAIAKQAEAWGVDLMNCIAMIPVHDTAFEHHRGPTSEEIDNMRQFIGHYVPQMTHCKRCRADAIGRLCEA